MPDISRAVDRTEYEKRNCLFCDASFIPKRLNQLYCCAKHRNRLWKPIESNCKICNKTFWKDKINQEFCSKNCSQLHHIKNFERPKIPKSVFIGTRDEIVKNLENWLEENGYFEEKV